jgi:2',3'-cyclic-nucleotide 2'-phosphodiesterase (5'-nucleotidase family)
MPRNLRATARGFFVFAALALCAATGFARTVTVTVLNTTDLHGSVRRTPGVYAENNDGSLLQCATLVRRIRAENPHALLLDCGDIFQGTAESFLSRGGIMATAMNAMGYDAYVVGNHEFDWGTGVLSEFLGKMQAPALAANLQAGPEAPAAFRKVLPFIIKEVDGIKVAVVGLTTPNIPNWTRGVEEQDIHFLDSRRALEATLPLVRKERPQVLILLAHQGQSIEDDAANQLNGIGDRFGEFDLVLGGHMHAMVPGVRIGKVDYAQAGYGAGGVMRVDLVFDTVKDAVVDKKFKYVPVTGRVREDPAIRALVDEDLKRADAWLNKKLGKTKTDLTYSPTVPGLCPVQQLLCAAIAEATGAEVVMHGILSNQGIPMGAILMSDIWRIVPYENTIGCLWLTLEEIRAIMEESAAYLGDERYFASWGLQYEVYPNARAGKRIRNLRAADGSPINGKRRIQTALNSYQLAGGGGRFPALAKAVRSPNSRLEMLDATTRDMAMDYVRRHRTLSIEAGTNAVVVLEEPRRWLRRK